MTGDVVLLNSCLASGACVDITVRDGVIHEIGNTEAPDDTLFRCVELECCRT